MKRRSFVGKTLIGGFAALVAPKVLSANENKSFSKIHTPPKGPVSICTWSFTAANAAAAKALESGSDALTAAIKAYDPEWVAKCIDQEKRNNIAQWDNEGNLIS